MEDFYLSQALFRTQEILDNFTNERSMQVKLKALTENGRIEKIKNEPRPPAGAYTGTIPNRLCISRICCMQTANGCR